MKYLGQIKNWLVSFKVEYILCTENPSCEFSDFFHVFACADGRVIRRSFSRIGICTIQNEPALYMEAETFA